jgi:glycosyltransferase involved in cell wall biosynthesis
LSEIAIVSRSLGRRCGVAEYAAELADRLGAVVVPSAADVPAGTEIALIQYESTLYLNTADTLREIRSLPAGTVPVLDAHYMKPGELEALRWEAIVGVKRSFQPGTVRLRLSHAPLSSKKRAKAPSEIVLGSFGFALPQKRYEDIIALARRLGVKATILAAPNDSTDETARLSADYLQKLRELAGDDVELIDDFLPMAEVVARLQGCSHLISCMVDNLSQSASLRQMADVGRPLISVDSHQATEVGAVVVDSLDDITIEFLKKTKQLPSSPDGFPDYEALIERLREARELMTRIEHPDSIYLDDPRQMERLEWLRDHVHGRAIEVGIGSGFSTNFVHAVAGAEVREDRLAYGSLRYPHIDFHLLDARNQALPEFDTVILAEIVEHMPFDEAKDMIALWAQTDPRRILVTTPNATKADFDEHLVHNPEHVWEPSVELVRKLVPAGYRGVVEMSSNEDFFLVELDKVAVEDGSGGGDPDPRSLQADLERAQRQSLEREVYAVTLEGERRRLATQAEADKEELAAAREEAQRAAEEREALRVESQELRGTLAGIVNSRTWRLTAPIRDLTTMVRGVKKKTRKGTARRKTVRAQEPQASPVPRTAVKTEVVPDHPLAACTVVSKNYLGQARVLVDSFKEIHPDIPFYVLLADRIDGYFNPEEENFQVVLAEELDIPEAGRFRFHYNVLEHDTAVKPYFFAHILERYGHEKLMYFDPDIEIMDDLTNLYGHLDGNNIMVVPHTTVPIDDEFEPNELTILLAGTFNLGFLGMSNTPTTAEFLRWWQRRLYAGCRHEPDKAMNVDQKWIDLAPSFFDGVFILKEPGYNVAYWNLHSRKITRRDGKWFINGQPCYFMHFSGLDPENIKTVSKYQNRFTVDQLGKPAVAMFDAYAKRLLAAGHAELKKWPYAFNRFDNGVRIPDLVRPLYRAMGDDVRKFGDPFMTEHPKSFYNWLNSPADGQKGRSKIITRLWYEVYKQRPDVQAAYPDVFGAHRQGFLNWVAISGPPEQDIDPRFVIHEAYIPTRSPLRRLAELPRRAMVAAMHVVIPYAKPVLRKTVGRNERVWSNLQRSRDRMVSGSVLPVPITASFTKRLYSGTYYVFGAPSKAVLKQTIGRNERLWGRISGVHGRMMVSAPGTNGANGHAPARLRSQTSPLLPFGVNIAGYLTSEKGTGEAARSTIPLLESVKIPVGLNNIIDIGSVNNETKYDDFLDTNPYLFNLVYVNADQASNFAFHKGESYFRGHHNVGVWNWEIIDFPKDWLQRFDYFDEIWTPTNFVLDAVSRVSPIPVVRVPYALDPNPVRSTTFDITKLGVSPDDFVFLFMFDFHSVIQRKNPSGLIEAFRRAFPERGDAVLLIKSSHADASAVREMTAAARGSNIKVVDTVLTREEINALYEQAGCYVTLHRSEGFGLTPAEAMLAEKPVIATGYSGNMDFMAPDNSYLVSYKLVELDAEYRPYEKGSVWADPDLDHAASLMRHVYENRDEARRVGQKAREGVLSHLHPDVVREIMIRRLLRVAEYHNVAVPAQITAALDKVLVTKGGK